VTRGTSAWRRAAALLIFLGTAWAGEPTGSAPPGRDAFRIGGWAGALYEDGTRDGRSSFFDLSALYLHADWRITSAWRVFAEVEREKRPDILGATETGILLERAYLEYEWSERLKLRLGKFNTQAGIVKPLHWDFTLDTVRLPIMEDNSYVPAKSLGLELLGARIWRGGELSYSLALSHGESEAGAEDPIDDARGAGFDVSYARLGGWRAGLSGYVYTDPKDDDNATAAWLPYLQWRLPGGDFTWRAEALRLDRQDGAGDISAWYSQLKWQATPSIHLVYRFDRGEDERNAAGAERQLQSLTLGWRPSRRWRMKLEAARDEIADEAGEMRWSAWAGWLFQ